jgi:hypothetical protein
MKKNCDCYEKCVKAKCAKIKCLKAKKANIDKLNVKDLTVKNLTVNGEFIISSPPVTLTVGKDKDFKTPQEALDSLTNRVITSPVTIKICPGVYPHFDITQKWFSFENGFSLTIIGDERNLSDISSTIFGAPIFSWVNGWVNNNNPPIPPPTEINYQYLANTNQTKVYNKIDKIKTNGLVSGDVVVFYNNDQDFTPTNKSERFLERSVITVGSEVVNGETIEFFTVVGNLLSETNNGLNKKGSSVTFLPNVIIESPVGSEEDAGATISVNTGCTIQGLTCASAKSFPADSIYNIGGIQVNTNKNVILNNIVIKSIDWVDVSLSNPNVTVKGFSFQFGIDVIESNIQFNLCILGTGHLVESNQIFFIPSLPVNILNSSLAADDFNKLTLIGSIAKDGNQGGPESPTITLANLNNVRNAIIVTTVNMTDQEGELITSTAISNVPDILFNYGFIIDCKNGYILDNVNVTSGELTQDNTFINISDTAVLTKNNTNHRLVNDFCNNCNKCYVAEDTSVIRISTNVVIDKYLSGFQAKNNSVINILSLPMLLNPEPGAVDYCVSDNGQITFSNSIPNPPPVVQC